MPAGISIEVRGVERVNSLIDRGPQVAGKALERLGMKLIGLIKEEAPKDTGQMAGSWYLHRRTDFEYVASPNAAYALYVYTGRKPGGNPPPFGPIERWAHRHNLPAGPVWYKIWKKGIPPNPFVDRALERLQPDVEGEVAQAAKEAWT